MRDPASYTPARLSTILNHYDPEASASFGEPRFEFEYKRADLAGFADYYNFAPDDVRRLLNKWLRARKRWGRWWPLRETLRKAYARLRSPRPSVRPPCYVTSVAAEDIAAGDVLVLDWTTGQTRRHRSGEPALAATGKAREDIHAGDALLTDADTGLTWRKR